MKSLFLSLIAIALFTGAYAQSYKFDGDWSGRISINGGSQSLLVRIKIDDGSVSQYFYDEDSETWSPVSPVLARYSVNKNNFMFYWMNNSTVWSETQTYMLSYVNDDKLYVVWSRQVNNIKDDDDNDAWSLQGAGYLIRRD